MVEYIGEHLWAGQLGHALAIVSLVGGLLGTLGFFLGTARHSGEWIRVGRIGFRLHSVAVLGIVMTLFTMLFNHWFEYDYVWKHSNLQMPLKFIASCFWEGQEGSFLLWTFWHMVLGNVLMGVCVGRGVFVLVWVGVGLLAGADVLVAVAVGVEITAPPDAVVAVGDGVVVRVVVIGSVPGRTT